MSSMNGSGVIRVFVSAASAIRRAALEGIVRNAATLKLVGSTYQDSALAHVIEELQPDVLLWDVGETNSRDAIWSIASDATTCRVVLFADNPAANWAASMLRAGVRAILPRDSSAEEIVAACHAVHSGLALLGPETVEQLVARIPTQDEGDTQPAEGLTSREIDVLRMLAEGLGNKDIAAALAISEHTVKFHVSSILSKLGADSRTEAVTTGLRQGILVL